MKRGCCKNCIYCTEYISLVSLQLVSIGVQSVMAQLRSGQKTALLRRNKGNYKGE